MSEHTPLTEADLDAETRLINFIGGHAIAMNGSKDEQRRALREYVAARTSTATAAEFCEHGFRPEPGRCPAGCTEATHTRFGEPSTADTPRGGHFPTTPVQCSCGWRETDPGAGSWADHFAAAADTGLRERVEVALDRQIAEWSDPPVIDGYDLPIARSKVLSALRYLRDLLATAAPTTDTGARD